MEQINKQSKAKHIPKKSINQRHKEEHTQKNQSINVDCGLRTNERETPTPTHKNKNKQPKQRWLSVRQIKSSAACKRGSCCDTGRRCN